MAQRSDLRTAIRTFIRDENSTRWSDTTLNNLINDAMRDISSHLRTNVKTTTLTFGVSDTSKEWPTDLIALFEAKIDDKPIWKVSPQTIRNRESGTGSPCLFYVVGGHMFLYPTQSASTDVDLTYLAYTADFTQDTDTPDQTLGPWADMLIKHWVAAEALMPVNSDAYMTHRGRYEYYLAKTIADWTAGWDYGEYPEVHSEVEDWTVYNA